VRGTPHRIIPAVELNCDVVVSSDRRSTVRFQPHRVTAVGASEKMVEYTRPPLRPPPGDAQTTGGEPRKERNDDGWQDELRLSRRRRTADER